MIMRNLVSPTLTVRIPKIAEKSIGNTHYIDAIASYYTIFKSNSFINGTCKVGNYSTTTQTENVIN